MEARRMEIDSFDAENIPLDAIRWSAVFAGLTVGLGVYLLLMLFGVTAGFTVFGTGERPDGATMSIAAATWNTIGMLISALVGGFVAARASGLRRTADGMLHGVVSWGAAMLFFAIISGSLTGSAISGMLGMSATSPVAARSANPAQLGDLMSSLERGDRESAMTLMRERFGMNEEQAAAAADRALAMSGRSASASPQARSDVREAAQVASAASTWLSAMVLLSLLAGAGGGLLGAGSARKRALHGRYDEQRDIRNTPLGAPLVR